MRDLPIFVFFLIAFLLWAGEYSTRYLPELGIIGAIGLRVVSSELIKLYPSFGDPAQRLAALVAMVSSVFFYGGLVGPRLFPGSRGLAYILEVVRLASPLHPAEVDAVLRWLGLAGMVATTWSVFPVLFPWELRGSHERAGAPVAAAAVPSPAVPAAAAKAADTPAIAAARKKKQ